MRAMGVAALAGTLCFFCDLFANIIKFIMFVSQSDNSNMLHSYHPAQFFVVESPDFPGYYLPDQFWNGWRCPFFDRNTAERIAAYFNQLALLEPDGEYSTFSWRDDTLLMHHPSDGTCAAVIHPRLLRTDSGFVYGYSIGFYEWCWELSN